jgi:hypothetical protein
VGLLPSPDLIRLIFKDIVERLAGQMCAFAYNQPAVVGAIGQKVHQALQTAEISLLGVLILMRPGLVFGYIRPIGESEVDGVERYDQVFCVVDLFKGPDHARLRADRPCEGLMREPVAGTHALLVDYGKVFVFHCGGVVALETETTISQGWKGQLLES